MWPPEMRGGQVCSVRYAHDSNHRGPRTLVLNTRTTIRSGPTWESEMCKRKT